MKFKLHSLEFEIEGNEDSVKEEFANFRTFIINDLLSKVNIIIPGSTAVSDMDERKGLEPEQKIIDTSYTEESSKNSKKSNKSAGKITKSKSFPVEKFDIHAEGEKQSLEDFLKVKQPTGSVNTIAVIAYYIMFIKELDYFSEGNIDYAYRTLSIPKIPIHLRQVITNAKNKNDFFEPTEDGKWKLTRTGELFVHNKLPVKKS